MTTRWGGELKFFKKVQNNGHSHTHTSSQTKNTMSNTTPNTQTPTNPTNTQNVAVKQLAKEEVKAVAINGCSAEKQVNLI